MPMYGRDNTVGAGGTAAAPAAGTAIATIAAGSLPAGTYLVYADIALGGTLAAADDANMQLQAGAAVISKLPALGVAGNAQWDIGPFQRTLDGVTALTVNAVGNATAASRYVAAIRATRMEVF